MIKADEIAQPSSCLNQSRNDEPVFVICGRDPVGGSAVREWARHYFAQHSDNWTQARAHKHREALDLADAMDRWRLANTPVGGTPAP